MKKKLISIGALMLVLALILTLVPSCGNGDEEATPTPGPGFTPTPGVTPTPTGEVKTLKIGIIEPLSGAAAPWGIGFERGAQWAADKLNTAGGLKVGADTYMIKTVSCDDKYIGSEAALCATRFVYDENIHYVVGPIGTSDAVDPTFTAGDCFYATGGTVVASPDMPYRIVATAYGGYPGGWNDIFLKQATSYHPEAKTICFLEPRSATAEERVPDNRAAAEKWGMTVLAHELYERGLTDFYPILTKIVAKKPDVIGLLGSGGDVALQTKQVREMGYDGWLWQVNMVALSVLKDVAGTQNLWNIASNEPDWTSDAYPARVREMYEEWQRMYPGDAMDRTPPMGYSALMMYAKAIEQAGSIDVDEVMKVLDDPNFRFDTFFMDDMALGGIETYGVRRQWQLACDYGEINDLDNISLSMSIEMTYAP